ncbi:MAG: molecular chaperone DjiA [Rhodobacteraceae bacterium]|nr:molecular chaperone DjiA [Paracoccaceae bacterium]
MSIWTRISNAIASLRAGEGLSAVFDLLRTPPERSVAFTIAVIALGAKMAKADGRVTRDEVTAFRDVFAIPPEAEKEAARVFNLARQDVAGFDDYAHRIARMFPPESGVPSDLMEGLFHIALADGVYHPGEDDFLAQVAAIFGMSQRQFRGLRARYVDDAVPDPYDVLGVAHGTPLAEIRKAWRAQVRYNHPDAMIGRGLPREAVKLAEKRLIDINHAWDEISKEAA